MIVDLAHAPADRLRQGGKGSRLAELAQLHLPIPPSYAVTTEAWQSTLRLAGLDPRTLFARAAHEAERNAVQQQVLALPLPEELRDHLRALATTLLRAHRRLICRSSATGEDGATFAFAGQFVSVPHIRSPGELEDAVRRCWASLYAEPVMTYAQHHGIQPSDMALVVQPMLESVVSGVAFSSHPITGTPTPVIEASWGLGELLVQGYVTPDQFVAAADGAVLHSRVSEKSLFLRHLDQTAEVMAGDLTVFADLSGERCPANIVIVDRVDHQVYVQTPLTHRRRPCLNDAQVALVARHVTDLARQYGAPQDMEFAFTADGHLHVLQLRPATALPTPPVDGHDPADRSTDHSTLIGAYEGEHVEIVAPGLASGRAVIVDELSQLADVQQGDVLVSPTTTPDYVAAMTRASAIVSADGGLLSHTAIVSRELGKPCLSVEPALLSQFSSGQWMEVDARHGRLRIHRTDPAVPVDETPAARPAPKPAGQDLTFVNTRSGLETAAGIPVLPGALFTAMDADQRGRWRDAIARFRGDVFYATDNGTDPVSRHMPAELLGLPNVQAVCFCCGAASQEALVSWDDHWTAVAFARQGRP